MIEFPACVFSAVLRAWEASQRPEKRSECRSPRFRELYPSSNLIWDALCLSEARINVEIGKGPDPERVAYRFPETAEEALAFVRGNF